jgi:DNA/RNA-binding domain of Phe-tRNA-synthetase-like protein
MDPELDLRDGWVEPELAEEFPELGLVHAPVDAGPCPSPREVKHRLRAMADRYTGGKVIHMRQDPVPWAYRVFSRQVGIDPDRDRTPVEAIALERLKRGGLRSENLVLDRERVAENLGLRLARAGERLGAVRPLSAGQIVVADGNRPVAVVLGEVADDAGVTSATERMLLCALSVKGVPRISVEEALWLAAEVLAQS